eukprot:TRINITY_DN11357_c0_g1_i2.p1 TRINITY_DN11357_c0_g1~~TRINITY_DN11357_c0_g1_i2.p1  ORF type:complete len:310 (-),score=43.11 TRINITY_DN11357_c0_g1_i2:595-1524(-)
MVRVAWSIGIASCAVLAQAFVPEAGYAFETFVQDFGRPYVPGTKEYSDRKRIFEAKLQDVLQHNIDASKTWRKGINGFADMTPEEVKGRFGYNRDLARGLHGQSVSSARPRPAVIDTTRRMLPRHVDWREKGVITTVKDQGHCGSCWAFSTTSTVESYAALATGTLQVLSTQQLVSCAPNPLKCGGVGGCEGSIPEVAFNYIQQFGMTTEWMMPYTSYYNQQSSCRFNLTHTPSSVRISGYEKLPTNDYDAIMAHLAHVGPLSVNVDASRWLDYESGVYDGCNKTDVWIDHVVQLVGYGTDLFKGGDYV